MPYYWLCGRISCDFWIHFAHFGHYRCGTKGKAKALMRVGSLGVHGRSGRVSNSGCGSESLTTELEQLFGPLPARPPVASLDWAYDYVSVGKVGFFRITLSREWSVGCHVE